MLVQLCNYEYAVSSMSWHKDTFYLDVPLLCNFRFVIKEFTCVERADFPFLLRSIFRHFGFTM